MSDEELNPIIDILCAEDVPPDWLVPEMFLQGTLICLAGEPGAGKSYVSYTIGLAIASGVRAFSGLVPAGEPKRVLYFDEENSVQDRNKYLQRSWIGLKAENNGVEPDLKLLDKNFLPVHFELGGDDWVENAQKRIDQWQPHVMMFDTATPAFNIADENSNSEATQAIKNVRTLMCLTDPIATALVIKHARTRADSGGKRSMRGAKAWQGAADAVLFQVKATGRPRKDKLALTRLEPDKVRAYGLQNTIYITPQWTNVARQGLALQGSTRAGREHRKAEEQEEKDLDKARR